MSQVTLALISNMFSSVVQYDQTHHPHTDYDHAADIQLSCSCLWKGFIRSDIDLLEWRCSPKVIKVRLVYVV